jgi:DNA polymerase III delta prime subunit
MYAKLISLSPEQIFLIQGGESFFEEVLINISKEIPNLEHLKLSRFTKEDAKVLTDFNLERSGNSWIVVYFDIFMPDAAQVLLKTLEEPREGICIILVTPHPFLVPQTIRSRVRLLLGDVKSEKPQYISSKKEIEKFIKDVIANEDFDASDRRAQASHFLDELEYSVKENPEKLNAVYEAKDMLFKANMPTKQVVEYAVAMIY